MDWSIFSGLESAYLVRILACLAAGYIVGTERELRHKVAGISTNSFVIAGAMSFAYFSLVLEPGNAGRIAAGIVTGIGFLGAGIILKGENGKISNLTTAASIWFAAAIGMAIGFGWYLIALFAVAFAIIVPRIPHVSGRRR